MSNTDQWQRRLQSYRYSLDDRMLSYKYQKELEPVVNKFLDESKDQVLVLGSYNLDKEPWRRLAVNDYRKYGVKVVEKAIVNADHKEDHKEDQKENQKESNLTELSLVKQKLTRL